MTQKTKTLEAEIEDLFKKYSCWTPKEHYGCIPKLADQILALIDKEFKKGHTKGFNFGQFVSKDLVKYFRKELIKRIEGIKLDGTRDDVERTFDIGGKGKLFHLKNQTMGLNIGYNQALKEIIDIIKE